MGKTDMNIIFDNPGKPFLSGEIITGWLVVNLTKRIRLRRISVEIQGKAKTQWYKDHRGIEKYFTNTITLLGGKGRDEVLQPGEYRFKFQMLLPENIPSSFEGAFGHVRYKVKGKIDRSILRDCCVETPFIVISLIDLNFTPDIKYPLTMRSNKHFLHGVSKSSPLTLVTKIDVRGFDLHLTVEVDNESDVDITAVKYEIQRRVIYYTTGRSCLKFDTAVILKGELDGFVPKCSSMFWTRKIKFPQNSPPSFMKKCNIIDLDYRLQVKATPSGFHLSLETDMPVILGTKPVNNNVENSRVLEYAGGLKTLAGATKPVYNTVENPTILEYAEGLTTFASQNKESKSKWPNSRFEQYF